MAAVGLCAVFLLPPTAFALLAGLLLAGLGGWEAARLAGLDRVATRGLYAALLLAAAFALMRWPQWSDPVWPMLSAALVWLFCLAWLARPAMGGSGRPAAVIVKSLTLAVILLTAWLALSWLQARSPWLVVLLIVIIAAADIGAYFFGRHFGRTRLAPRISPGKTRAGAFGGLASAGVLTPPILVLLPIEPFGVLAAAPLAVLLALISIGGDLFISLLKRQRNLKDTSALLPGHGGVLDRFDSLSAALPFYVLAIISLGPAV